MLIYASIESNFCKAWGPFEASLLIKVHLQFWSSILNICEAIGAVNLLLSYLICSWACPKMILSLKMHTVKQIYRCIFYPIHWFSNIRHFGRVKNNMKWQPRPHVFPISFLASSVADLWRNCRKICHFGCRRVTKWPWRLC